MPVALDKVPYTDFPELKFSQNESTEMPFRYVADKDGNPIMPEAGLSILATLGHCLQESRE
jgi:ribosome biogenesis SPOUT family RNA methylase Rps3